MNGNNLIQTRRLHPSAMRSNHTRTRPAPTLTPLETLTSLLHLTRTKLSFLYSLPSSTSSGQGVGESDFLRRSVLLQNVYEDGMKQREKEVERDTREREMRFRENVLGMSSQRGQKVGRGWKGPAFEVGMDALFEGDEDEDEDEDEQERSDGMSIKIVDPLQYAFGSAVVTAGEVGVEGEEAWFEQTWSELQGDDHGDPSSAGVVEVEVGVEVEVEVYPVEEDDSIYSPSSSSSSSRSTSPSSIDQDFNLDLNLTLPPTPKLRPTKIDDKLDGPVEWGTRAAALECAVEVEWIMERWEVLDDEEEEEFVMFDTSGPMVATTPKDSSQIVLEGDDASDSFSDPDMDVPDLIDEYDEQDDQHLDSSSVSRLSTVSSSSSSSAFDEPLLVTPTEDALDDFDQVHADDEDDERDYDDDQHQHGQQEEKKVACAEVWSEGKAGGLFMNPSVRSGGGVRVGR